MSRVAEDAVHRKILFAEDLGTDFYRGMMQGFIESTRRENDIIGDPLFSPTDTGHSVCDELTRVLQVGENFCVATEMMRLAQAVAPTMPDEPLLPHDLPSPAGFMWFQIPYRQIDIRRKILSTDAIVWEARNQRVKVWHFTRKDNDEDWVNLHLRSTLSESEFQDLVPSLSMNHTMDFHFNQELPRGYTWDTPLPFDAKVRLDTITNPDGTKSYRMATDHYLDNTKPPEVIRSPLSAFIVCLWRLCQQTLAVPDHEQPTRAMKRRLGRMAIPDKPITVIRLRKRERKAEHPEAKVEWSHQWLTRGHWRHQPYKEEGDTVYRWIWIHPFLKGPPDKPLLVRDKVNFLVR